MPRGRSKSRKNRKGNEESQAVSGPECEDVAGGGNKKKSGPKEGPDSPGRGCGKLKHLQESGEHVPTNDSSTGLVKDDVTSKKASNTARESENNSAAADEKANVTPRRKKGRRKSQEQSLNESSERELQMPSEEILEQVEEEKVQPQKQKKNKNEKVEELEEISEESKKEKKINKESADKENNSEILDPKKKFGGDMGINSSGSKNTCDEKSEKDSNTEKDSMRISTDANISVNSKEEKKEEVTSKTPENWLVVSSKRQRKKDSKDREDSTNVSNETRGDKSDSVPGKIPEHDERMATSALDEQNPRDGKGNAGMNTAACAKQNDDMCSINICERKLSVHEIKQRFCMDRLKDKENNQPKISPIPNEAGDDKIDIIPVRKTSKEKLLPGSEGDIAPSAANNTTTELFVSTVGEKESMSSSSLFRAESPTEIIADEGAVNLKPKSQLSAITPNIGKTLIDKDGNVFGRGSFDPPKISVKQLRERLISSCSKLNDKIGDDKVYDTENKDDDRSSSDEIVIDKHTKGHEKKDYNISLKERLESYRCQATKEFQVSQTSSLEQDIPAGTSIKELQSSFDKMHQPNVNPTSDSTKNKVKTVNDEIHHAQEYMMKCKSCGKQVFLMERIMAEKSIWHKTCFRCSQCRKQLTVENYKSHDGVLYCEQHYNQILKPKRAEGTISAHNTTVEEVNISAINVKSLFEKNGSSPTENVSSSTVFAPVEKSPKFLKRLRRFEKKMSDNSEDDSEKQKALDTASQKSSPEKGNKTTKDELENSTETENEDDDGCRSVKSTKDSESSRKSTPSNSPRGKGKTLHGHLKQLFEKHDNEQTAPPSPPPNKNDKKSTGSKKSKGNTAERLQICDVPKKPAQGPTTIEDPTLPEIHEKMMKTAVEENEINKYRNATKEIDLCEQKEIKTQPRDVHSVISYFNQQQ